MQQHVLARCACDAHVRVDVSDADVKETLPRDGDPLVYFPEEEKLSRPEEKFWDVGRQMCDEISQCFSFK